MNNKIYKCKLYLPEHCELIIYDNSTKMCELVEDDWTYLGIDVINDVFVGEIFDIKINQDPVKYFSDRKWQDINNKEQMQLKNWQSYVEKYRSEKK